MRTRHPSPMPGRKACRWRSWPTSGGLFPSCSARCSWPRWSSSAEYSAAPAPFVHGNGTVLRIDGTVRTEGQPTAVLSYREIFSAAPQDPSIERGYENSATPSRILLGGVRVRSGQGGGNRVAGRLP